MTQHALTDRQQREIAFYQQYAQRQHVEQVDLAPVLGKETRPWNPYWFVYELARRRYVHPGQRLLDFGCGNGIAAVRLAHLGYQVDGFDLCPANVEEARQLAARHHCQTRCTFRAMAAEALDYSDNTFDVIVGIDILHHIELGPSIQEAHRVLKPGGIAVFKEHVEAPLVDPLRNTALVRAIAPREVSLDHHITEDERKLNDADLERIESQFERVETHRFTLLSRLDRLGPFAGEAVRKRLQQLDHQILARVPVLRRLAGTVVVVGHKRAA